MPRRRAGSAAGPATSAPAPARGARPRPPPGPAGRAPASPHRPAAPSPPRVGGCGDPRCPPRPAAPGLTLGTSAGEIGNGEETDKRELKKKKKRAAGRREPAAPAWLGRGTRAAATARPRGSAGTTALPRDGPSDSAPLALWWWLRGRVKRQSATYRTRQFPAASPRKGVSKQYASVHESVTVLREK